MKDDYVLISPCRNEAKYMRQTIDSILLQTVLPTKWVIVDDGSTDATPDILQELSRKYTWIEILTRNDRGHRAVGPGVIEAFYEGLNTLEIHQFEYLCKLDLDLVIPPRYFEILLERMRNNPRIATCSGKSYIKLNTNFISENHGDDTSLGMTKFYRVTSFLEIGGFVREVMWDGIDCHRCRMLGWIACSWDEPDLRFIHLRPMGSSQVSVFRGRMRHGFGQYYMGTGFLYIFASAMSRITEKPAVVGGLAIIWGWIQSAILLKPRYGDLKFRKFLRKYQLRVLLVGKRNAIEEIQRHEDSTH